MNSASRLLQWYDRVRRDLPWRRTRDPYAIWVSEIMLQQTRVETVIPYYMAFLDRFPTVEDLAKAPEEDVLARWSGLGYYRRARQLHAAAKKVVELGSFPKTSSGWLELPGIGPYTSAAIASIAFGEVIPVLDGNVERFLCRRLAWAEDPKRAAVRRQLLDVAAELLDPRRPGDSNQALMELGATICRPKQPTCESCPLAEDCRGRQEGDVERFPRPRRRRPTEKVILVVAVVQEGDRILFFRRPKEAELMPGMWELPNVRQQEERSETEQALGERYGGKWTLGKKVRRVRHQITFRALTLEVHTAEVKMGDFVAQGLEGRWISEAERKDYGMSSIVEKVFREKVFEKKAL